MLAFVEPEGVQPAIVGGEEDLQAPIAIQVGRGRVGFGGLDDVVIFADGCAGIHGGGAPVEAAGVEAAAVGVEDIHARCSGWAGSRRGSHTRCR